MALKRQDSESDEFLACVAGAGSSPSSHQRSDNFQPTSGDFSLDLRYSVKSNDSGFYSRSQLDLCVTEPLSINDIDTDLRAGSVKLDIPVRPETRTRNFYSFPCLNTSECCCSEPTEIGHMSQCEDEGYTCQENNEHLRFSLCSSNVFEEPTSRNIQSDNRGNNFTKFLL